MSKTLKTRITQKHDIEANWLLAINFTPMNGEIIIYDEDDNYNYKRIKIGNGIDNVNDLDFVINKEDASAQVQSDFEETDTTSSGYIKNKIVGYEALLNGECVYSTANAPQLLFDFGTYKNVAKTYLTKEAAFAKDGTTADFNNYVNKAYSLKFWINTGDNWMTIGSGTPKSIDNKNYVVGNRFYIIIDTSTLIDEYKDKFSVEGVYYMSNYASDTFQAKAKLIQIIRLSGDYITSELVTDRQLTPLETTDKTVVGAINEINEKIINIDIPEPDLSDYALKSEVPSVEGLASEEYVNTKFDELFQNVSSGKELIASAITDKGVYASDDETFQELSDKIGQIIVGPPGTNIIGYIDEENDIYLSLSELENGTYTLKLEDNNGLLTDFDDIGEVEVA